MHESATGPRVAVIVPCYADGKHVGETLDSIREEEPVELVLVDDGSRDELTRAVVAELESDGTRVVRHPENRGVGAARNTGLEATSAPYVFALDSDDLAVPGGIARLADLLDGDPGAAVAYGDYEEFGDVKLVRAVPERIDPYRLAYTNEYPPAAMFRRRLLEEIGGWDEFRYERAYYEDWHLWMDIAQRGERGVHAGPGYVTYRQRVHGPRLLEAAKRHHVPIYRRLREDHVPLFSRLREHRRRSELSPARKVLYPLVYGGRPRLGIERKLKESLDRAGLWTMRR
jgi:glycosyltransferase involved in cell wall biosynthesis